MDFQKILLNIQQNIATITMNSPATFNAFDGIMLNELLAALNICEEDEQVKVILLQAEGKAFCGGGDVSEMYREYQEGRIAIDATIERMEMVPLRIRQILKPIIVVVHGAVAGAAFSVALACDFCVAAENTKFIQAFVNVGLAPDGGGMFLLSRAVGTNRATQLAMTGAQITAAEGKSLGFVYQVCPRDKLRTEALQLAQSLVNGPSVAYEQIKRQINHSDFLNFEEYLRVEEKSQRRCGHTRDYQEGITAFTEKRSPVFRGY